MKKNYLEVIVPGTGRLVLPKIGVLLFVHSGRRSFTNISINKEYDDFTQSQRNGGNKYTKIRENTLKGKGSPLHTGSSFMLHDE